MEPCNTFILAVGSEAGGLLNRLASLLSAQFLAILPAEPINDWKLSRRQTHVISPTNTSIPMDRTAFFPPLPDWENLKNYPQSPGIGHIQASRFGARLSILEPTQLEAVQTAFKAAMPERPEAILILADFSDSFASGILWDCLAMARQTAGKSIPVSTLLGIPVETSFEERNNRAELYAALKELNFFFDPQPKPIDLPNHLMDRAILFNRKYLETENSAGLEALLCCIHKPQVLLAWMDALALRNDAVPCFHRRYPLSDDPCELQMTAFAYLIPMAAAPSLLTETFRLQMVRDIFTCLMSSDKASNVYPQTFLHELGLDRDILTTWVEDRVKELLTVLPETEPQPLDELISFCLNGQNRLLSSAARKFRPLLSRNDRPGQLGKKVARLLDTVSIQNAVNMLTHMEDLVSEEISHFGNDAYVSQQASETLETFITNMTLAENTSQGMLADHQAGKFMPAYAGGISHSDLDKLATEQTKNAQQIFTERHFGFLALSQCWFYLECIREDIRKFIRPAMEMRLTVFQKAFSAIESQLKDCRNRLFEMGIENQAYYEAFSVWFAALDSQLHPEPMAEAIRNQGIATSSAQRLYVRHLEKTYAEPFSQAVKEHLNIQLDAGGSGPRQAAFSSWLKEYIAPEISNGIKNAFIIPPGSPQPEAINLMVLSQADADMDISRIVNETSIPINALLSTESPVLIHIEQGIPLSYLNGIQHWFLDYQDAIFEEQPVHVIKSLVYMGEAWIPQGTVPEYTPISLFWMALTLGVLEEKAEKVSFPSRRACYWNLLWNRSENAPIWLTQQEMIQIMNQNGSLCQEIAERIEGELTRPPYEYQKSGQVAESLLIKDRLQPALHENPSLKPEIIRFMDRIFRDIGQTASKTED